VGPALVARGGARDARALVGPRHRALRALRRERALDLAARETVTQSNEGSAKDHESDGGGL